MVGDDSKCCVFYHQFQILSDKARLTKRTQLKRTPYRVLGKPEDNEHEQNVESQEVCNLSCQEWHILHHVLGYY